MLAMAPCRNRQPEQFLGNPGETLETHMMTVMQIGHERLDFWTKGRTGCHALRRLRPIATSTTTAAPAPQFDTGYDRLDRRQIDMVVALTALLRLTTYIRAAMVARAGHDTFGFVGRLG
jgi:hypothetical protein